MQEYLNQYIASNNISLQELRSVAIYTNRGRQQTQISDAVNYLVSNALTAHQPLNIPSNLVEVNRDRNCRNDRRNHEDTSINLEIANIINPPQPLVHDHCFNCLYANKGVSTDFRRSTCGYGWENTQQLLKELSVDSNLNPIWPSYKLPGSPGFAYVNKKSRISIGMNLDCDPQDFRINSFDESQWLKSMGVVGFNIGDYKFIKNDYIDPTNYKQNLIPLFKIPYELLTYPNQFYSMATASCLVEDAEEFSRISSPSILNIGSGSGYLSVLMSKFNENATLQNIELENTMETEMRSNFILNNIEKRSSFTFGDIVDINPRLLSDTTHLIANLGTHYGHKPFDRILTLTRLLPNLRYICLGGFSERDLSFKTRVENNFFKTKSMITAPMLLSILKMQRSAHSTINHNSFEGFVSMSFIRR